MTLTATPAPAQLLHLHRGPTSVIVRVSDAELPTVLHWGGRIADSGLTDLVRALEPAVRDSIPYTNPTVAIVPLHSAGWLGHPGIMGSRRGRNWSFSPGTVSHSIDLAGETGWTTGRAGAIRLRSVATDEAAGLKLSTVIEVHPSGVVRVGATLKNIGDDGYELTVLEPALPVPATAAELLDMTGRHTRERTPQRRPFTHGRWTREAWGGRPGHDSATVMCAGTPSFGFRRGPVWGIHVAWSGNSVYAAERSTTGWQLLRGGEILLPGEVILDHGDEYSSPWIVASWGDGLDDFQAKIHTYIRTGTRHPHRPRPVLLNTWEAVYFDHDEARLMDLAERAAALGVERFVLDDGWFLGRRDDTAGLGDWYVDPAVWPNGLAPLAARVHELGMEFGLWFEPEMINLDSDLARTHPDWVFATDSGPGLPSRYQHVLDLGNPEAFEYVKARISELVTELSIDYIKWDQNRPLVDSGHAPAYTPGVHRHTLALYRLIDELKAAHPRLEIESCCGGGGRIDLGIMERCDRVWVSDCIDAHERQRLQRWTSLLLPPELLGTHVGADEDHSTLRKLDLDYRAGTAIWGHFGIEWDLATASPDDLTRLGEWIALHKELRPLLHHGTVVHDDPTNPALVVEGVVARDRTDALYRMSVVEHSLDWPLGRIRLPGLDPERTYRVHVEAPSGRSIDPATVPDWVRNPVHLSGAVLGDIGLTAPTVAVDRMILIRATAASNQPRAATAETPPQSAASPSLGNR